MSSKAVKLDVDSSIIERKLLLAADEGGELDTLFPKNDEPKSKLIQPAPVCNKMSEENKKESEPTEASNVETKNTNDDAKVDEQPPPNEDKPEEKEEKSNSEPVEKPQEAAAENKQEENKNEDAEEKENDKAKLNADEVDIGLTLEDEDVDQLLNDELKVIDDSEAKVDSENSKNDKNSKDEPKKDSSTKEDGDISEKQPPIGRSLWVSGLSSSTRANDLKKHFLTQGRVVGAKVVSNSRSPRARCYGYIVMSTAEEADQCVKNLHHSKLLNRFISVKKAKNEKGESIDTKSNHGDDKKSPRKTDEKDATKSDADKPKSDTKKPRSDSERRRSRERRHRDSKDKDKVERTRTDSERERERQERQRFDRMQRMREERRMREKRQAEEKRLRDAQMRQREEAIRLDREKQKLRFERERLQREKLELLRLEKEQLEKEREEIKRQKKKIEEANRRKKEAMIARQPERTKRHRERSPPRRSPEISSKISKKHHDDKYKEDRHHKDSKYKDGKEFRASYKSNEFPRGMEPSKYDRYSDDKNSLMKSDEFMKGGNSMGFEPPPPRISSSEASHFSVLPNPHSGSFPSNRFRDDFHGKDIFSSNSRNDRVSDRFPVDRHDRMPSDSMDHRGRSGFPPVDAPRGGVSRMDSGRMGRDMHIDPPRSNNMNGRYPEGDRDMRHREGGWYGSGSSVPVQKRVMSSSMPSHRGEGWSKSNMDSWEGGRHFDDNLRPPGVYGMDRMKNDRH